jgi:tetratricopeptide (TPR) repeat protein
MDFGWVFIRGSLAALYAYLLLGQAAFAQDSVDWKSCQPGNDVPEIRAIADCTELINAVSSSEVDRAQAYYRRGAAHWRKEDYAEAIADESKAIELDPKFADAYVRRGAAYFGSGDNKSAIADLTKAIDLDPDSKRAYIDRSSARYREKMPPARSLMQTRRLKLIQASLPPTSLWPTPTGLTGKNQKHPPNSMKC